MVLTTNDEESSKMQNPIEAGWKELMGNDLIFKELEQILPEGDSSRDESPKYPDVGDAIRISFKGRILGPDETHADQLKDLPLSETVTSWNSDDETSLYYVNEQNWFVTLGDGDILPAMEMGVRFLPQHQVGVVRCHSKYAHGLNGRKGHQSAVGSVPANSSIEYCIKIHKIISSDDFTHQVNLQRALWKKKIATDFYFKHEEYSRAFRLYKSATDLLLAILTDENLEHGATTDEARKMLVDCYNNMAFCHMKQNDYFKAKQSCTDALQHDPDNIKALCRAIKCCMELGLFDEADAILEVAQQVDSTHADVERMTRLLKYSKKQYKQKEKELYEKMVAGIVAEKQNDDVVLGTNNKATGEIDNAGRDAVDINVTSRATRIMDILAFVIPIILALVASLWQNYSTRKAQS